MTPALLRLGDSCKNLSCCFDNRYRPSVSFLDRRDGPMPKLAKNCTSADEFIDRRRRRRRRRRRCCRCEGYQGQVRTMLPSSFATRADDFSQKYFSSSFFLFYFSRSELFLAVASVHRWSHRMGNLEFRTSKAVCLETCLLVFLSLLRADVFFLCWKWNGCKKTESTEANGGLSVCTQNKMYGTALMPSCKPWSNFR